MSTCRIGRRGRRLGTRGCHGRPPLDAAAAGEVSVRRASRWSWVARGRYSGRVATACSSSTRAAVAPGSRSSSEPGTRSAKTRTRVHRVDVEPGAVEQRGELVGVKRRPAPALAGTAGRSSASSRAQGLLEVAGHGPGDHGGVPLGDQQAERAAGTEHLGQRGRGRRRGRRRPRGRRGRAPRRRCRPADQSSRLDRSPWRPVTAATPLLAGPPVEGGQGVGAGVDDRDPVAELGDPDREPAGAAADVEDVARGLGRRRAPGAGRPTPRRCGRRRGGRCGRSRWLTWRPP